MKWRSDMGSWDLFTTKWFAVYGTTPRNADQWTVTVYSEKLDLLVSGHVQLFRYLALEWWRGDNYRDWELGYYRDQCRECRDFCGEGFCTCKHLCRRLRNE